jgi:hypothetical protein
MSSQPGILFIVIITCNPELRGPVKIGQIKWLYRVDQYGPHAVVKSYLKRLKTGIANIHLLKQYSTKESVNLVPCSCSMRRFAEIDKHRGRLLAKPRLLSKNEQEVFDDLHSRICRVGDLCFEN